MLHLLLATIPTRKRSCERLLAEVAKQTRVPNVVHLVLDGYGKVEPAPQSPPTLQPYVWEWRWDQPGVFVGPGGRWGLTQCEPVEPDHTVVVLDDDVVIGGAPRLIEMLADAVDENYAAGIQGVTKSGRRISSELQAHEDLICAGACGFALRAQHLAGLAELAQEVKEKGGGEILKPLGDDEALVCANLWRRGVGIRHVAVANVTTAPGTQKGSQSQLRCQAETWDHQRHVIAKATGWPWPIKEVPPPKGAKLAPTSAVSTERMSRR